MVKIVIAGCGGSGKDFLKEKFFNRGFCKAVSVTTRPPRVGEKEGVNYNFTDPETFKKLEAEGWFLETDCFNGWMYGTSKKQFMDPRPAVFIMTPRGIAKIPAELRPKITVIYLDIPDDVRFERLSKRGDGDSVIRRLNADVEDFKDFTDFDIRITNPNF